MKRRTVAELTSGDPRTLRLVGGGFDTERIATVEYGAERMQTAIERADLRSEVPSDVRDRFEMVRVTYTYALFAYELFSVAEAYGHLLYEMALGERFIELYARRIPLIHRPSGERTALEVARFGDIWRALHEGPRRHWMLNESHAGWSVEGHTRFLGSLPELLHWAHGAGLLRSWLAFEWSRVEGGVRRAAMSTFGEERVIPADYDSWDARRRRRWWATFRDSWQVQRLEHVATGRHLAAHPEGGGLHGPSTFAVHDLARFINSLWSVTSQRM